MKEQPVFVGGKYYPSRFDAGLDSGVSGVTLWKRLKASRGEPCVVRRQLVASSAWVEDITGKERRR